MKPTKEGYYWYNNEIVEVTENLQVRRFGASFLVDVESLNGEWYGPLKVNCNAKSTKKTL